MTDEQDVQAADKPTPTAVVDESPASEPTPDSAKEQAELEAGASAGASGGDQSPQPEADGPFGVESGEISADAEPAQDKAAAPRPQARPERPEITALREALAEKREIAGKVIGWNNGGLHVVVDGVTAFCPRSEIEIGAPKGLESYLDQELVFHVLRVQKRGRRVVLSRRSILQGDRNEKISDLRKAMESREILEGKVSSVTDFGAFVDIGGVDGLVHVSELSRSRVEHPSELVAEGDSVQVRILKIGENGKRISLSMKALEPDPWDGLEEHFPAGSIVKGKVEQITKFGAFVEIAPGITGLLPTSAMNLPRDANPARVYHAGKEVSVQVLAIDRRRRRISLSLEGSQVEATRADLKSYLDKQGSVGGSFGALAAAFDKARQKK